MVRYFIATFGFGRLLGLRGQEFPDCLESFFTDTLYVGYLVAGSFDLLDGFEAIGKQQIPERKFSGSGFSACSVSPGNIITCPVSTNPQTTSGARLHSSPWKYAKS
jgi:hypothetical protein